MVSPYVALPLSYLQSGTLFAPPAVCYCRLPAWQKAAMHGNFLPGRHVVRIRHTRRRTQALRLAIHAVLDGSAFYSMASCVWLPPICWGDFLSSRSYSANCLAR
jgi:hypothetical protein